jgi:hypothetical protein
MHFLGERRTVYKVWVGKPEGNTPLRFVKEKIILKWNLKTAGVLT